MQGFDFDGQAMEARFEVGEAGIDGIGGGSVGFLEHCVDGDAGHFGDGANAGVEAEFAEFNVFVVGETEADHAVAQF